MSIEKNDPRLTAYALGEMEERDRALFERELDAAARAEIAAIRALGADLTGELGASPGLVLSEAQRATVTRTARTPRRRPWLRAAAALMVVALGVAIYGFATAEPQMEIDEARAPAHSQDLLDLEKERNGWNALDRDDLVTRDEVTIVHSNTLDPSAVGKQKPPQFELDESRTQRESVGVVNLPKENPAGPAADPAAETSASPLFFTSRKEEALRRQGAKSAESVLRELRVREIRLPEAGEQPSREAYDRIVENAFRRSAEDHTSTFSIDVDTASYANVRRYLISGRLPPKDAVRIEELVNYFRYDYAPPSDGPFATHVELADCPWNSKHKLARIAIKGHEVPLEKRPVSNLVFLIDVSGSMQSDDKLPLLQKGLGMLVDQLDERDRVAIVVYAGAAGCVLDPTNGTQKQTIRTAIDNLRAGGSTNGAQGIQLAYQLAREHFLKGGINRVILCTDGDFNVGITDRGSLTRLIEEQAKSGVFLSVLGFGTGNYQDASMEELSNKGNGNYAYIDSQREARKVLVEQMSGTLMTIAKDVKIQIFFNPNKVAGWRLIGYENRVLAAPDFNDDKKDAGDIGAGHTVTALYELVPAGKPVPGASVDANPFVAKEEEPVAAEPDALFQLRLRYKLPDGEKSSLIERYVKESGSGFDVASPDFRFAAGVAAFGMLLRESPHIEGANFGAVIEICHGAMGKDPGGYRAEFVDLAKRAAQLKR